MEIIGIKIDGGERVERSLWVNERRTCGHQVDLGPYIPFRYASVKEIRALKMGICLALAVLRRRTGANSCSRGNLLI